MTPDELITKITLRHILSIEPYTKKEINELYKDINKLKKVIKEE